MIISINEEKVFEKSPNPFKLRTPNELKIERNS
jgi:hypothetical protein